MGEKLKIQNQQNHNISEYNLVFYSKPKLDMRRYNCQRANEVAAIFQTSADGQIPEHSVVVRNRHNKVLKKLSS